MSESVTRTGILAVSTAQRSLTPRSAGQPWSGDAPWDADFGACWKHSCTRQAAFMVV